MLNAQGIVKVFEKNQKKGKRVSFHAVDHVSLSVGEGEILGILGPNGAGKTTLLRILGRLMKPTEGQVFIRENGADITDDKEMKARIGYLSGNTKLYGRLSAREHLTFMGRLYGMDDAQIDERIDEIIELLSMSEFIDNRVEKLSTGQTQRAAIARCLIHNPSIYIFDEPTLGLDIISSNAIVEFMKQEKEKGKTVIYSTHYMEEAEYLCDRIIMLNKGSIVMNGTIEELLRATGGSTVRDMFLSLIKEGLDEQ